MLLNLPGQRDAFSPFVDKLRIQLKPDPVVKGCSVLFTVKAQRICGCVHSVYLQTAQWSFNFRSCPPSWYLLHSHQSLPTSAITTKYQC